MCHVSHIRRRSEKSRLGLVSQQRLDINKRTMLNFFIIYKYQSDTRDFNRFASGCRSRFVLICYDTWISSTTSLTVTSAFSLGYFQSRSVIDESHHEYFYIFCEKNSLCFSLAEQSRSFKTKDVKRALVTSHNSDNGPAGLDLRPMAMAHMI